MRIKAVSARFRVVLFAHLALASVSTAPVTPSGRHRSASPLCPPDDHRRWGDPSEHSRSSETPRLRGDLRSRSSKNWKESMTFGRVAFVCEGWDGQGTYDSRLDALPDPVTQLTPEDAMHKPFYFCQPALSSSVRWVGDLT